MNRLAELMRLQNLNGVQLAEELEVNYPMMIEFIRGRVHLKDYLIVKICKKYKVSADWLLGIANTPKDMIGERCNFTKRKHNWVSGCGWRVNYNEHWAYCPHCGRRIMNLARLQKGD